MIHHGDAKSLCRAGACPHLSSRRGASPRPTLLALLVSDTFPLFATSQEPPAKRAKPFFRGVCLTLHDEDTERDYSPEVAEIASRLGASHVSILFHLSQPRRDSPEPGRGPKTPAEATLRRVL